jgi:membrane protease YdiL (CAAX protease family)
MSAYVRGQEPALLGETTTAFIKRHEVATYYALTFAISWTGMLLVGGRGFFAGTNWQTDPLFQLAVLALLAGPPVAGLLLTGIVSGTAGFGELFSRLIRWRVGARWYALAILTAPLLMTGALLGLSLVSPEFTPAFVTTDDKLSPLLLGLMTGLVGALVEEFGWTGFALPRLRLRHGVLATGLIMGVLWVAWHLLQVIWTGRTASGPVPPALFVSIGFFSSYLLPYRVIMVWVYDHTESLLVAILMHASLIVSTVAGFGLVPPAIAGVAFLTMFLVFTAAEWALVGAVAAIDRRHSERRDSHGAAPAPSSDARAA